jgi:hypothetical protein
MKPLHCLNAIKSVCRHFGRRVGGMGSHLNSEILDSCAPAHFKLGRVPASSPLPSRLCLDHSHCPVLAPATLAALPSTRAIETRSLPSSFAATHRGFAFYVAFPKRSIPSLAKCSMSRGRPATTAPRLTHSTCSGQALSPSHLLISCIISGL